jgi:beta-glucosidase
VLPLTDHAAAARIAVIGGHAELGVVAGFGSSAVLPAGGYADVIPLGGVGLEAGMRNLYLLPSSPLDELRKQLPDAQIEFDAGTNPAEAVPVARRADVVIVFATRAEGEGFDIADLSLPSGQDELITAVAAANPNTVVVLETGNPTVMPWRDAVNAIVQAWYPGQQGGRAIAEIIAGQVNPSGRLPITFPVDLDQTPRPQLPELDPKFGSPTTIHYSEGADVGHRWFARTGQVPLFGFGHGLTYTTFDYRDLEVTGGDTVTATFRVVNTGTRSGTDVPQLYLTGAPGEQRLRLLGFERVDLGPGESRRVRIESDPRLLARYDGRAGSWRITAGVHLVAVGASAVALKLVAEADLTGRTFGR